MTPHDYNQIWDLVEAGESYASIGEVIGRRLTTVRDYVNKHHGRRPLAPKQRSEKRLAGVEREEISRGLALDESFRAIGRPLGRSPSTVSREVKTNGGRAGYRAVIADAAVAVRAKRPKVSKLASDPVLRALVEAKRLTEFWSPEQIAGWLPCRAPRRRVDVRVARSDLPRALHQATHRSTEAVSAIPAVRSAAVGIAARTKGKAGSAPRS